MPVPAVIFDLGGVLIEWDPRHLYRKLIPDAAAMEHFLATVCTPAWNEEQDAGRPLAEATAALIALHPDRAPLIEAFYGRWLETLGGAIDGTVEILEQLHRRGVALHALTNWSGELFHHALERFPFLARFGTILVSGREGMRKPDPRIYRRLLDRAGLAAADAVYIDDMERNCAAARELGLDAVRFTDPARLRVDLAARGLLLIRLALALALGLAACESGPASPCDQMCEREARCTERQQVDVEGDKHRFDAGECTTACKALERDGEGKKLVERHRSCVAAAGADCAAVLACP